MFALAGDFGEDFGSSPDGLSRAAHVGAAVIGSTVALTAAKEGKVLPPPPLR